jgi:hypothetical protein
MVPVPFFEKLWFRFLLLESSGSGSSSISRPYRKIQKKKKNVEIFFAFLLSKQFYKEKFINFNKFLEKCK